MVSRTHERQPPPPQFSHFCTVHMCGTVVQRSVSSMGSRFLHLHNQHAHLQTERHPDRHKDHATFDICRNRPHLCYEIWNGSKQQRRKKVRPTWTRMQYLFFHFFHTLRPCANKYLDSRDNCKVVTQRDQSPFLLGIWWGIIETGGSGKPRWEPANPRLRTWNTALNKKVLRGGAIR